MAQRSRNKENKDRYNYTTFLSVFFYKNLGPPQTRRLVVDNY